MDILVRKLLLKRSLEILQIENPKFNITTINPGMVLGPQAFP